jgi:transposase
VLTISPATQIYLAAGPTDMRKSFYTLAAVVRNELDLDPLTGALFAFCNRRKNLVKILVWQRGRYLLLAKRLERGTFAWPHIAKPCVPLPMIRQHSSDRPSMCILSALWCE